MAIHERFADVLDYPGADLARRVAECTAALEEPLRLSDSRPPSPSGFGEPRRSSAINTASGGGTLALSDLPVARQSMATFSAEVARLDLASLQEAYTSAFDLDPRCTLYVGHHLFGEDARRGVFMARLAREYGRPPGGGELPDHLGVILRYLDQEIPETARTDLIADAIVPAVRAVAQALADRQHPYAPLLGALLLVLQAEAVPTRTGRAMDREATV